MYGRMCFSPVFASVSCTITCDPVGNPNACSFVGNVNLNNFVSFESCTILSSGKRIAVFPSSGNAIGFDFFFAKMLVKNVNETTNIESKAANFFCSSRVSDSRNAIIGLRSWRMKDSMMNMSAIVLCSVLCCLKWIFEFFLCTSSKF